MKGKKILNVLIIMILIILTCIVEYFVIQKFNKKEELKPEEQGYPNLDYTYIIAEYDNGNSTLFTFEDDILVHCRYKNVYASEEEANELYETLISAEKETKVDGNTVTFDGIGAGMSKDTVYERLAEWEDKVVIYEF